MPDLPTIFDRSRTGVRLIASLQQRCENGDSLNAITLTERLEKIGFHQANELVQVARKAEVAMSIRPSCSRPWRPPTLVVRPIREARSPVGRGSAGAIAERNCHFVALDRPRRGGSSAGSVGICSTGTWSM